MATKITHLTPRTGGDAQPAPQPTSPDHAPSLEATLPPTPLKKLLAADGAAVYVLSSDSVLVDAVTTAGGDQFPIQLVPTLKALRALIDTGQCKIALLDAEPFGSAVRAQIAELKAIDSELVVLVAAPRETAEELMGLFSERVIHRLLIKPAAIGITRLLLESAVSRFLQIREAHAATLVEPIVAARRFRQHPPSSRSAWLLAIALVTVLVAGVLIGGLVRLPGGADRPRTEQGAEAFASPTDSERTPLDPIVGAPIAAEIAGESVPIAPPTESAAQQDSVVAGRESPGVDDPALGSDPQADPGSADEVADVAGALIAGAALAAGDEPSPTSLEPAAEPTALSRTTSAAAAAAPPSEIDSLLALARARAQRGQLLAPAGDSTRDYVERALAIEASNSEALAIGSEVGAALANSARVVLEAGDIERASGLTSEARRFGAPSETLALLEVDLAAARQTAAERLAAVERARQQLLAIGIERMQQGRLVAPESDSAVFHLQRLRAEDANYPGLESAWRDLSARLTRQVTGAIDAKDWIAAESWIVSLADIAETATVDALRADLAAARLQEEYLATPARAGELGIVTVGAVSYPEQAQRLEVEGWVETEFVVGTDGVPRGARVVGASPRGWFEDAALAAVVLYRYEPFERDGRVYERLARVRIRFNLQ
jgi:protein TonB